MKWSAMVGLAILRICQEMPDSPGADMFIVPSRQFFVSFSVMGMKVWVGCVGGSSCCRRGTLPSSVVKKCCARRSATSSWLKAKSPCSLQSAAMVLDFCPCLHFATSQTAPDVTSVCPASLHSFYCLPKKALGILSPSFIVLANGVPDILDCICALLQPPFVRSFSRCFFV
jgi:hypothetical protein